MMVRLRWSLMSLSAAVTLTVALAACRTTGSGVKSDGAGPAFLTELKSPADYHQLERNDAASKTTFVKFTVDLRGDGSPVYFQNTATYFFHQAFLTANVERFKKRTFTMDQLLFGQTKEISGGAIYDAPNVKLPGTNGGVIGFELYFENEKQLNLDEISTVYQRLQETIPYGKDRIAYLFSTPTLFFANKAKLDALHIPSGRMSQVVGQGEATTVYAPFKSYGYLKAIDKAAFDQGDYTSKDILIFDAVPLDVGPLSGIITTAAQVPHSHVIFRAFSQKIPDVYIPNALSLDLIKQHLGQLVELTTLEGGLVTIRGQAEIADLGTLAATYFATRVPKLPPLVGDFANTELFHWQGRATNRDQVASYGTKGTNFAIIDRALVAAGYDRSIYNGSFLVPLSYYKQYLSQPVTAKMCKSAQDECTGSAATKCAVPAGTCAAVVAASGSIDDFLKRSVTPAAMSDMISDNALRKAFVAFAVKMIEKGTLDPAFVNALTSDISKGYAQTTRMRFRSSTNAEDLPGMNGAGFYVSKGACLADTEAGNGPSKCMSAAERQRIEARIAKLTAADPVANRNLIADMQDDLTKTKPLAKAIKKVFASVWNEKALLNRDYYKIDHMGVAMAMLCHPSYTDEAANGVLVATTQDDGGLEVNIVAQIDDISITNPEIPDATPDQLVTTLASNGTLSPAKYVLHSNQTGGKPVLSDAQIQDLVKQVAVSVKALQQVYGADYGQRMDMEYKVDGAGKVLIKQGRPL